MQAAASNGFWLTHLRLERKRQRSAFQGGNMKMFDRTQLYVSVAFLGVLELAAAIVHTVAR